MLDRDDPSKGNVSSFVRRGYTTAPTGKSAWVISGGPGLSTKPFIPMFDYFISLDSSMTAYLVDARGTGLSSSTWTCTKEPPYLDPYNDTYMDMMDVCNREIIDADRLRLPYITTYHAALDLQGVMNAVQPDTTSLFAASYGVFFANTLLQLPGIRVDVIVYDGPMAANRWPLENNARMQSMVSFDSLRMCAKESSVCAAHLGEMAHIPQMTKDAIVDGTLPCLEQLPWLAAKNGNYLSSLYNNFLNPTRTKALLGPFWHRLYRCSESDVTQLNFFHKARQNEMSYWGQADYTDYSRGYAVNAAAADLYSYVNANSFAETLTYEKVVDGWVRSFVTEGGDLTVSFARDVSEWPYPPRNPLSSSFAKPTAPVHILVGTLDHNTPLGQAKWAQDGMGPDVDCTVYIVPYGSHGIVDYDNLCAVEFVTNLLSLKSNVDDSCLYTSVVAPDWDGSEPETQNNLAAAWFGTADLWNNGMLVDGPIFSEPSSAEDFPYGVLIAVVPVGAFLLICGALLFCGKSKDTKAASTSLLSPGYAKVNDS